MKYKYYLSGGFYYLILYNIDYNDYNIDKYLPEREVGKNKNNRSILFTLNSLFNQLKWLMDV